MLVASHRKSGQETQTSALGRWIDRHCKRILKDVLPEEAEVTSESQRLGLIKQKIPAVNPNPLLFTFFAVSQNGHFDGSQS